MNCNMNNLIKKIFKKNKVNIRNIEIINSYYGINNYEKKTLKKIGEKHDLSKERVRQIIKNFNDNATLSFNKDEILKKELININKEIKRNELLREDDFIEKLYKAKIIDYKGDSLSWIFEQNESLGESQNILIEKINNVNFVIPSLLKFNKSTSIFSKNLLIEKKYIDENDKIILSNISKKELKKYIDKEVFIYCKPVKKVRSFLIKENIKNGFINKNFLKNHIDEILEEQIETSKYTQKDKMKFVMEIAKTSNDYIEINNDWFFFSNVGRNVFKNNVYKILSKINKISIKELSRRILFSTKINKLPDEESLSYFFKKDSNVSIYKENNIYYIENKNIMKEKYINNDEEILFRILEKNGKMRHKDFYKEALNQGVSYYNFCIKVNNSPLFLKPKRGIYSIY